MMSEKLRGGYACPNRTNLFLLKFFLSELIGVAYFLRQSLVMNQDVHGKFAIKAIGQVLIARPIGSWNVNCAYAYNAAFAHTLAIISLRYKRFLGIADMRYWQLGTPDALEVVHELPFITQTTRLIKVGDVYFGSTGIPTKISKDTFISEKASFWQINELSELQKVIEITEVETSFEQISEFLLDEDLEHHPLSPRY